MKIKCKRTPKGLNKEQEQSKAYSIFWFLKTNLQPKNRKIQK
jgi:hypothetical protein